MSLALPIAMLAATVLGGVGTAFGVAYKTEEEDNAITLSSGQKIRIQTEVRLRAEKKDDHPNSCLLKVSKGTVTSVDGDKRTVTVRCGRGEVDTLSADDLEVVSTGLKQIAIPIPGGYAMEGSTVRLLESAKRTNVGKGLASPFHSTVGIVVVASVARTQIRVRTVRLNDKSQYDESWYDPKDLEFVGGPLAEPSRGVKGGIMKEGSSVQLKKEAEAKYTGGIFGTFGTKAASEIFNKKNIGKKLVDKSWQPIGRVVKVLLDPKNPSGNVMVTVRCVSKKGSSTEEEDYPMNDLELVAPVSIPRPGIPVFGGMAREDVRVKLRDERKSGVTNKPLGRPAFGDVGTVTKTEAQDPNNLSVYVTCNGNNPDELTGDWYEPEDLEIAEPEDTEGEPVFGGRVMVGSTVRVMQSARGKKCLGTVEFGDYGMVKGIDPSAPDNLKINVSCGRSMDAKQSEWYDPRDLSVYFPQAEVGSELAKAQSELEQAKRALNDQRMEIDANRNPVLEKDLETKVEEAQKKVDELSEKGVDKTKATELYKDARDKLAVTEKLKRDLDTIISKVSKETTCSKDPSKSAVYGEKVIEIVDSWSDNLTIPIVDMTNLKPTSVQFKNTWNELYAAFQRLGSLTKNDDVEKVYSTLVKARRELQRKLDSKLPTDENSFSEIDDKLIELTKVTNMFEKLPVTSYKTALITVDEKLKKLKEIAMDIESAAYSGNSPAEKLLKRVETLMSETETKKTKADEKLGTTTGEYDNKFEAEQLAKDNLAVAKSKYDVQYRKETGQQTQGQNPSGSLPDLLKAVNAARRTYLTAQKETLKARKDQALASAESTCLAISVESIEDMKNKIKKIVDGKCGILDTTDKLSKEVSELLSTRQRVLLMTQGVLDPKFGDPKNAIFTSNIGDNFDERIDQIKEALAVIETQGGATITNLEALIALCGKYQGDRLYNNASEVAKNPDRDVPRELYTPVQPIKILFPTKITGKELYDKTKKSQLISTPVFVSPAPEPAPESKSESETPASIPPPAPPVHEQESRLDWVAEYSSAAAENSGFQLGKTPGNGDCLFGAVASALAGSDLPEDERERQETDLRARAVAYIADPKNIATFTVLEVEDGGITGYVQTMSQAGVYGGDPEIAALEGVLGRCINVWQPRTGGIDLEPARGTPREGCLHIFYNGINHYDPLYGSGPTGGKRKWPFYGRRKTRRQHGGVDRSIVEAAKAAYDKLEADYTYLNDKASKLEEVIRNTPLALRYSTQYKTADGDLKSARRDLAKINQARAIQRAEFEKLRAELQTELDADKAVNPFSTDNPEYSAPTSVVDPLLQGQNLEREQLTEQRKLEAQEAVPSTRQILPGEPTSPDALDLQTRFNNAISATNQTATRLETENAVNATRANLLSRTNDKIRQQVLAAEANRQAKSARRNTLRAPVGQRNLPTDLDDQNAIEEHNKRAEASRKQEADRLSKIRKEEAAALKRQEVLNTKNNLKYRESQEAVLQKNSDKEAERLNRQAESNHKLDQDKANRAAAQANTFRVQQIQKKKENTIRLISKELAEDQIVRLQSRTVGQGALLDLARSMTVLGDQKYQLFMDQKTDLQFTLAQLVSGDNEVASAVGYYESEVKKLNTCISTSKAAAIKAYSEDSEKIEKEKKELTAKTFEVKQLQPQQLQNAQQKNPRNMSLQELNAEIARVTNLVLSKKANNPNANVVDLQNRLTTVTQEITRRIPQSQSGGRRRTMRRSRF